ncbi:MAG: hypothetical protein V3U54_07815 [Thermodesulfobacteriota bacterium]
MGVSTTLSWEEIKEERINGYIDSYDNGEINKAELREGIIEVADNNLEAIDILDFAGAL